MMLSQNTPSVLLTVLTRALAAGVPIDPQELAALHKAFSELKALEDIISTIPGGEMAGQPEGEHAQEQEEGLEEPENVIMIQFRNEE